MSEDSGNSVPVRRGKVDLIVLYEVTEHELELLKSGSPTGLLLNFAIFAISIAVAFFITLLTTTISSDRVFIVFVIITAVGMLAGLILFVLWLRLRKSISNTVRTIKDRVPKDANDRSPDPDAVIKE